jgi:APA family basic amino acid/polyamine antiporter
MIAALWTYDGWYGTTFAAGEMRDPQRTLPFGLVWGTVIVMVLYALVNLVYLRALSLEEMAATRRIGETAAIALVGPLGGRLVSFAVLVSTFGCLSATILYSARIYFPMARDGVFFRSLAAPHPRFHTPGRSLWAQSLWGVVLALSGTYEQLYTYVVFAMLLFHTMTAGAVIVLRRRRPEAERPYRVFGYPWVPVLFMLAAILLLGNTLVEKPLESLLGLALLAAGVPAYLWWRASLEQRSAVAERATRLITIIQRASLVAAVLLAVPLARWGWPHVRQWLGAFDIGALAPTLPAEAGNPVLVIAISAALLGVLALLDLHADWTRD